MKMKETRTTFRVMTYNIGGGRNEGYSNPDAIMALVDELQPDILGMQEAWEYEDFDGLWQRACDPIWQALGNAHYYFAPAISMRENFHHNKGKFIESVFNDWQDWRLGNAILTRYPFRRFSQPDQPGAPANLSIYRPAVYEGSRDTDPRNVLMARLGLAHINPLVMVTHLTTLIGEPRLEHPGVPGKAEQAQALRWYQANALISMVQDRLQEFNEFMLLMGDFNAAASEQCISNSLVEHGGFIRLTPQVEMPTHTKAQKSIDHILVHPGDRRFEYKCWVVDSRLARSASDHLPVVADITLFTQGAED